MSTYETQVRRVEADEIDEGFRELFCAFLFNDFRNNAHMTPEEAEQATFGDPENSLDALRRTAENPNKANIYVVNSPKTGNAQAVLKAGYELYADVKGDGLDSILRKLPLYLRNKVFGDLTSSALQLSAWGESGELSDSSDPAVKQQAFNDAIFKVHGDHMAAERLAAYVDRTNPNLSKLLQGIDLRTYRVGSKAVDITLGDVTRTCRRETVKLPIVRY